MSTTTASTAPLPAFGAGAYSIRQLPINLYGAVMGLAGMALAWRLAAPVFGAPAAVGEAMGFFALAVFIAHSAGYLAKLALHPDAVRQEFTDPVTGNFFGQLAISLLLLSSVLMPYGHAFAQGLWTVGVVVTFALALLVGSRLLKGKLDAAHMLPVWIIPGVGVLDIGVTGGHMPMAWAGEINLLAMAVGTMVALVLWTLIIHRLAHGEPLPLRMRPSLMILMAPFAVAFSPGSMCSARSTALPARCSTSRSLSSWWCRPRCFAVMCLSRRAGGPSASRWPRWPMPPSCTPRRKAARCCMGWPACC